MQIRQAFENIFFVFIKILITHGLSIQIGKITFCLKGSLATRTCSNDSLTINRVGTVASCKYTLYICTG